MCPSSAVASETLDTSLSSTEAAYDSTFLPLSGSTSSSSDVSVTADQQGDWSERKWIVKESAHMELFTTCHTCGVAIEEKTTVSNGSMIKVEWTCLNQHKGMWRSCPEVRGMPENNLVSSAAIIFTGTTETEVKEWADLINLQLPKKTSYYALQSTHLIPVVHQAYTDMQELILSELQETACSGGHRHWRSDSPGYSAKYTTYRFMDDLTKKIIMSDLIQVSEASSSPAMEAVGFRRGLDRLLDSGVCVDVVTTDRHPSIRKIMRESYPNLRHQFDPWHVAKGIISSKKKENQDLQPWVKSLGNHFWWSCSACGGDEKVEYNDGQEYQCYHEDLDEEQQRRKKWLANDCSAYNALKAVVLDKYLLKDLNQLTLFKHTGGLEVFHSSMLKYAEKRQHYSYVTMQARIQLSVLDHNHNVGRQHDSTEFGEYSRYSTSWPLPLFRTGNFS
uniref:Uncharacterized protein n=1 Tax=Gouania willdenowi TaxID=441366 RepID=A0A8C5GYH7_GOUWI